MSQSKVDKHKQDRKNRAKTLRRQKITKTVVICVIAVGLGALVGIPIGKKLYNIKKEREAAKATIAADSFETWFEDYWVENFSDYFVGVDYVSEDDASVTDAEETDTEESTDESDESTEESATE